MKFVWSSGLLATAILIGAIGVACGRYIDLLPWDDDFELGLEGEVVDRDVSADSDDEYPFPHRIVDGECVDLKYPGTACERLVNARNNAKNLKKAELNGDWDDVRRNLLRAGGMVDDPNHTGHSFNDFNHVDLTTMKMVETSHTNADGKVDGISVNNDLAYVIKKYSVKDLGPGGSWSTCQIGAGKKGGPQDVAHVQFHSRVAFKLVWVPGPKNDYKKFVLVDDEGTLLNVGEPTGRLPYIQSRIYNFKEVENSKYAKAAVAEGKN